MLIPLLALYSKTVYLSALKTQVYYEVPTLQSQMNLQIKVSSQPQHYYIALASDPLVVNANINVYCGYYYGPNVEGGVVYAAPKLTLKTVNIAFFNEQPNILLTVVRNNEKLFVFDSNIIAKNNKFIFYLSQLTSFSDSVAKNYSLTVENEYTASDTVVEACTKCKDEQSTLADHCWGCPSDQLIDNLAQKTCKCLYSNAHINADNMCVTSKIYDTVETMDDDGTQRAYALECTTGIQIDMGLTIAYASYASFGTLKDDLCVPKNMYVRGFIEISGMSESTFEYGGLAYRAEGGATNVQLSLTITNNARSHAGGLAYARTRENLTAPIAISKIYLMGRITESYSSTSRLTCPKGGIIAVIENADVQMSKIYTFGFTISNQYTYNTGLIVGEVNNANASFTELYIAPYQQSTEAYAIDPALGDWSKVSIPCANSSSEQLKPSLYLQALSKEYDTEGALTALTTNNVYNLGGLSGLVYYSNVTAKNVIARFDISCYTSSAYGGSHLFALVQYSNTTVSNCYTDGNSSAYRFGGPISMIWGGSTDMTIAAKFEVKAEYDGGVIARVNYTATVVLRAAVEGRIHSSAWYTGTIGYIQGSSNVNILEALGNFTFVSSEPSYFGYVCGRIEYSTLNGQYYSVTTNYINTLDTSIVYYCTKT